MMKGDNKSDYSDFWRPVFRLAPAYAGSEPILRLSTATATATKSQRPSGIIRRTAARWSHLIAEFQCSPMMATMEVLRQPRQ